MGFGSFLEVILDAVRFWCSGYQPDWENTCRQKPRDEMRLQIAKNNDGEEEMKKRAATKPRWSGAPEWKTDGSN